MNLTQREAFSLFKNIQYLEARERYEKTALAGGKSARSDYEMQIAELDLIYYPEPDAEFLSIEEIERGILEDATS